tara:strand:- start:388 stop:1401 length:1014 start_codon:yes stop_codon:yes gene_type:complete
MKKLLYIYPNPSTFVDNDIEGLSNHMEVDRYCFKMGKITVPYQLVRQFLHLLLRGQKYDAFLIMFGGYHSLLPTLYSKLFRKKSYIILGGTDCNHFPTIPYGYHGNPVHSLFIKYSAMMTNKLFPVSEELIEQDYAYLEEEKGKKGLITKVPNLDRSKVEVVHNGVSDTFRLLPDVKRTPLSYVSICSGFHNPRRRVVKGVDLFIKLAEKFPERTFGIIGGDVDRLDITVPKNVMLHGAQQTEEIVEVLNTYEFYCQLSVTEGFGIALLEAMQCGCTPIVSDVGIMPTIVGKSGYVLGSKSLEIAVELISTAKPIQSSRHSDYSSKKRIDMLIQHMR